MISLQKLRQDYGDAIAKLAEEHDIHNVRVTGSIGAGIECPDSDIDFLVTCGNEARPYAFQNKLIQLLKTHKVDVIIDKHIHPNYAPSILDQAVEFAGNSPVASKSGHKKINENITALEAMLSYGSKILLNMNNNEKAVELNHYYMTIFINNYCSLSKDIIDYFPHIAWQKFQTYLDLCKLQLNSSYHYEASQMITNEFNIDVNFIKEAIDTVKKKAPYKKQVLVAKVSL